MQISWWWLEMRVKQFRTQQQRSQRSGIQQQRSEIQQQRSEIQQQRDSKIWDTATKIDIQQRHNKYLRAWQQRLKDEILNSRIWELIYWEIDDLETEFQSFKNCWDSRTVISQHSQKEMNVKQFIRILHSSLHLKKSMKLNEDWVSHHLCNFYCSISWCLKLQYHSFFCTVDTTVAT